MSQLATIGRRAATWGVVAVLVALAVAVLGSGNLRWFDAALVGYLFGTLSAVFAVVYRYLIWLRRPPTARLRREGGGGGLVTFPLVVTVDDGARLAVEMSDRTGRPASERREVSGTMPTEALRRLRGDR